MWWRWYTLIFWCSNFFVSFLFFRLVTMCSSSTSHSSLLELLLLLLLSAGQTCSNSFICRCLINFLFPSLTVTVTLHSSQYCLLIVVLLVVHCLLLLLYPGPKLCLSLFFFFSCSFSAAAFCSQFDCVVVDYQ